MSALLHGFQREVGRQTGCLAATMKRPSFALGTSNFQPSVKSSTLALHDSVVARATNSHSAELWIEK